MLSWKYADNKEHTERYIGQKIGDVLNQARDKKVLLLFSGGSSLGVVDNITANNYFGVTVAPLDERFSPGNKQSNFAQLEKTAFYCAAKSLGCRFIDTKTQEGDTLQTLAGRYEGMLEKWLEENKEGVIVAIFGMGSDGHTAGIFPYPKEREKFFDLFSSSKIVRGYDAESKNKIPFRVTTTLSLFRRIDKSYAFVCGQEKRQALEKLKNKKCDIHELPAMIFYELKNMEIVTDIKD